MIVMSQQGSLVFIVVDGNIWSKQSLSVCSKRDSVSINKVSIDEPKLPWQWQHQLRMRLGN